MATKEKTEAKAGEGAPQAPPPKKKTLTWVLVGTLALVAVGGGGAYAWLKFMAPHKVEAKPAEGQPEGAKPGEKTQEPGAKADKIGPIVDLDPFIVNLADAESRYLKVTVKLEVEKPEVKAEVTERVPQVRDAILILLSSKDSQSLKPAAGKLQLREEILQRVNTLLTAGQARNVYFTEFVVQ